MGMGDFQSGYKRPLVSLIGICPFVIIDVLPLYITFYTSQIQICESFCVTVHILGVQVTTLHLYPWVLMVFYFLRFILWI